MIARMPNRRWSLVGLMALGLVFWFAAAGSPSTSADAGTLLHINATTNQMHLSGTANVEWRKFPILLPS